MKDRVQVWMSREDFEVLRFILQADESPILEEGGPFDSLRAALDEAKENNSNYSLEEQNPESLRWF